MKMWRYKIPEVRCPKLPLVKKCCYCIPVRKGIIIFGYVNLTLSLLASPLLIFLLVDQFSSPEPRTTAGTRTPDVDGVRREPARLTLTALWAAIDVAMNLALILSAHKKSIRLLRVYLYCAITFLSISLFIDLVILDYGDYLENIIYILMLSLNVYLLYLVYCTIQLLKETSGVQYVAHQDTLTCELLI